jgi:hypothetical protein
MQADPLDVFVGDPLCKSIDFMYTHQISGGAPVYRERGEPELLSRGDPFVVFLSTTYLENLDPRRMHDEHPEFGDAYLLDRLHGPIAEAVREGRCKVLIDYSGEAAVPDGSIFGPFHSGLSERGFDSRSFGLITSNHAFKGGYTAWAREAGVSPIHVFAYNHFIYHFSGTINIAQAEERDRRGELLVQARRERIERRFVCLNNMPRLHRFYVVLRLLAKGLRDDCFLSCLHRPGDEHIQGTWDVVEAFDVERVITREAFDKLMMEIPLLADVGKEQPRAKLSGLLGGFDMYAASALSIVTESEFSAGEVVRVTEKVLKPLANMQPMIAISSPESLQLLRDEGFQTFEPFIHEEYDEITGHSERMQAISSEIDRLASLREDELRDTLQMLLPRLRHNYGLLWNKARLDYASLAIHREIRAFVQTPWSA